MNSVALIINIGIALITAVAIIYMIRDFHVHKKQFKIEMKVGGIVKSIKASLIAIVTLFFDTLGIGCYAPMTASFKIFHVTRDKYIPGTLNVACVMATCIESIYFITNVEVDTVTLVGCIVASAIGAYLGARLITKLNLNKTRLAMGLALLVVAVVLILGIAGMMNFGGEEIGLTGWKLALIIAISFVMGGLMTIGIGIYAPLLATVSLLGMDPLVAYPIMLGCCAYLIPVAAIRFCQDSIKSEKPTYDRKIAVFTNTIGLIGPAIAMVFLVSLPMYWLKILVAIVVAYVGSLMLYQGINKSADKVASDEDEEKEDIIKEGGAPTG